MSFLVDTQELKPGLIIFRRADVKHKKWYCRMKLPGGDRYKSVSLKTADIDAARERAFDQDADLRFRIKHDVPIFNRPFSQIAKDFAGLQKERYEAGQIAHKRWKNIESVITAQLNRYVGSIQINLIGHDRWKSYPLWRQKNGKGYYKYLPGDRTRHDDPEAIEILKRRARELEVASQSHSEQEILERCLYPLINEGFRILEEGIAQRASDIDVVWCAGYGFPRYRGGPMFHAETIGLPTLLEGLNRYRARFGPMHWEPASLLVKLVKEGRSLAAWEAQRA